MTETDSMVVRVAKAMAKALKAQNGWTYVDDWDEDADSITVDGHVELMPVVRAAIEAMKEPTPAVLEEGYNKMDFDDGVDDNAEEFNRRVVQRVWSAMIRKALEE